MNIQSKLIFNDQHSVKSVRINIAHTGIYAFIIEIYQRKVSLPYFLMFALCLFLFHFDYIHPQFQDKTLTRLQH